jgi:hypothetical protein
MSWGFNSMKTENKPTKLEDCNPGATRSEVISALEKVASTPKTKTSSKHGKQPHSASS